MYISKINIIRSYKLGCILIEIMTYDEMPFRNHHLFIIIIFSIRYSRKLIIRFAHAILYYILVYHTWVKQARIIYVCKYNIYIRVYIYIYIYVIQDDTPYESRVTIVKVSIYVTYAP